MRIFVFKEISTGVPQGGILGPICYLLCTYDIAELENISEKLNIVLTPRDYIHNIIEKPSLSICYYKYIIVVPH